MKFKLTIERIIAFVMIVFALVILFECRNMSLTANYSVGPAALPVACSVLLIIFSVMVWITSTDNKEVSWKALCTPAAKRCFLLVGLTLAFILAMYFLGFWLPFLIFTILSFWLVEKHPLAKAVLMGAVWVVFLYVVFVYLLKMNIALF